MHNIVEKMYGPEYSPKTNSSMRYDIDMHVDAFLMDDKDNPKGFYRNFNREQIIPRQLFAYIMFRIPRDEVSIQAWIGYTLQRFHSKTLDKTKTFTLQQAVNNSSIYKPWAQVHTSPSRPKIR
mmetsp:Transcript_27725/g.59260  ORF Transcript_27725/g.59260 Transcript_27725/m.59260 type:complete len:123 (-) Transcript_27725:275-643(-)